MTELLTSPVELAIRDAMKAAIEGTRDAEQLQCMFEILHDCETQVRKCRKYFEDKRQAERDERQRIRDAKQAGPGPVVVDYAEGYGRKPLDWKDIENDLPDGLPTRGPVVVQTQSATDEQFQAYVTTRTPPGVFVDKPELPDGFPTRANHMDPIWTPGCEIMVTNGMGAFLRTPGSTLNQFITAAQVRRAYIQRAASEGVWMEMRDRPGCFYVDGAIMDFTQPAVGETLFMQRDVEPRFAYLFGKPDRFGMVRMKPRDRHVDAADPATEATAEATFEDGKLAKVETTPADRLARAQRVAGRVETRIEAADKPARKKRGPYKQRGKAPSVETFLQYFLDDGCADRWVQMSYTELQKHFNISPSVVSTMIEKAQSKGLRKIRVMTGNNRGNWFTTNPDLDILVGDGVEPPKDLARKNTHAIVDQAKAAKPAPKFS